MKKKSSAVVPVLLGLLVGVLGFGTYQVVRLYNQPLAEPLTLPAAESKSVALPAVQSNAGVNAVTPTPKPKGSCGNTGTMMVLFTGADFSKGVWPLGADSVRLIKIDFDKERVVVVSFPRDLVIDASGVAPENQATQRLGLTYYYEQLVTQGSDKDKILAGTQVIATELLENFAVQPEHYFTLQFKSLEDLFAAVGNVEIDNPKAFTSDYGVLFPQGKQTLTPALAAEFVRTSEPDYEAGRLARQDLFLKALKDKVLSAGIIPRVPALLEQFKEVITTDLSPNQLVSLACMVDKVKDNKVDYYQIIGDKLVTQGADYALLPKFDEIKKYLDQVYKIK
jgi:LCP family protein required for cell wall assembly